MVIIMIVNEKKNVNSNSMILWLWLTKTVFYFIYTTAFRLILGCFVRLKKFMQKKPPHAWQQPYP